MSYKYDSNLVIANRFSDASSAAKAQLWETYDRLRDLTVSGSGTGTGFESAGGLLYNIASLLAPSSFATVFGSSETMNISGTSYYSKNNSGSAYGVDSLYNYSGFPSGAASINSIYGLATGGASSVLGGWGTNGTPTGYASSVGASVANAAAYGIGTGTGLGKISSNIVMPFASTISGFGGILTAISPYLGVYGAGTTVLGNLMQGTSSAALAAYQNISGNITANADTILSTKVRNIETVCKMLDTQGDVAKKMLKEGIDSDSKAIQNL
ncbi:hypothetical protein IJ541_08530 [bacterium]|nr:hypothetical protein [bacterium]